MKRRSIDVKADAPGLPFQYEASDAMDGVTAHGGLPLVLETMRAAGVSAAVAEHVNVRKRKSGYSEATLVEAFVLMLAAGGECLDDMAQMGVDGALHRLLDMASWPSPDAARQFLLSFHDAAALQATWDGLPLGESSIIAPESAALQGLGRVMSGLAARVGEQQKLTVATLERDETIIESRKREALPHYKGGRGYQPSVVYWAEADMVVADEFRDGNVPAGKDPLTVIRRGFAALPSTVLRRRFRGDSACYEDKTLKWLANEENRIERFTVSADMTQELGQACAAVADGTWKVLEERVSEVVYWAEVEFTPGVWPKHAKPLRYLARRIVKRQGEFFASGGTTKYLAIVSNDRKATGPDLLRWHYARGGTIESLHDVVKNELGGGVMPCAELGANAAWWRLCLLTYNVMSALKRVGLPPEFEDARPKRLRFAVLNIAARVGTHARQLFARIARAVASRIDAVAVRIRLRVLTPLRRELATAATSP